MPAVSESQCHRHRQGHAHHSRRGQGQSHGLVPHIFLAILVHGKVNSSKGASADFLLDQVLVDAMLSSTVVLAVAVLRTGIECLLQGVRLCELDGWGRGGHLDPASRGGGSLVVPQRRVVRGERAGGRQRRPSRRGRLAAAKEEGSG
jgi:hypothetical protein